MISLSENLKDFWGLDPHCLPSNSWPPLGSQSNPEDCLTSTPPSTSASSQASTSELLQTSPGTPRLQLSDPLRDFWGLLQSTSEDTSESTPANLFADVVMPDRTTPKMELESVEVIEAPDEVYFNILAILPVSDWRPCYVRKDFSELRRFHEALSRELPSAWLPGFPCPQSEVELAHSDYHLRLSEYIACIGCSQEAIETSSVQALFNVGMEDRMMESERRETLQDTSVHDQQSRVTCLEGAQEEAARNPCGHICLRPASSGASEDCPLCPAPTENPLSFSLAD